MRTKCFGLFFVLALGAVWCSPVTAAPFEVLMVASKITGQCTVLTPSATEPVAIEQGKAYPYGSAFVTAAGASLQLVFSEGNQCTLSGEGRLSTAEDKTTPSRKAITLGSGKLDIVLDQGFAEINALDIDGICMRASITTGGKLSCKSFTEGELRVFAVNSGNATVQASGPQFGIAKLEKDQEIMAAGSPDLTFVRLKAVKGPFVAKVWDVDSASATKEVPMETGAVIKILQKRSEVENSVVVTLLIIGPDDTVKEAITYNVKADSTAPGKEVVVAAPPGPSKPGLWNVTVRGAIGGTISPPGPNVQIAEGGSQRFMIKAGINYTIADVVVDGASVGPKTSYVLTNVSTNHTIAATFQSGKWEPMYATTLDKGPFSTTTTTTIPPRDVARARAFRWAFATSTTTTTRPPTPVGLR